MKSLIQQFDLINSRFTKLNQFSNDQLRIDQIQSTLLLLDSEVPQPLNQFLKRLNIKQRKTIIYRIKLSIEEETKIEEAVELCYRIFLLVYPDPAGLAYYSIKLKQNQITIDQICHILAASRPVRLLFQSGIFIFLYHFLNSLLIRLKLKLKRIPKSLQVRKNCSTQNKSSTTVNPEIQTKSSDQDDQDEPISQTVDRKRSQLKIAIVNHRAGSDFSGGEKLVLEYAKYLNEVADVELVTTTAKDYITWANYYKPGICIEDGVKIRRFKVDRERNMQRFQKLSELIYRILRFAISDGQSPASLTGVSKLIWLALKPLSTLWMKSQGPISTDLQTYIKEKFTHFDLFIFHTYLYDTSYSGIKNVNGKAVLIPTAHPEWALQLPIWPKRFLNQKLSWIFLAEEERRMMHNWFPGIQDGPVFGCGIHSVKNASQVENQSKPAQSIQRYKGQFSSLYNLDKFILFTGRIDSEKGCRRLIALFLAYIETTKAKIKLVLVGSQSMMVPNHPLIISTGYIDQNLLNLALIECSVYVHPSPYESFSFSLLEAMAAGAPVFVTAQSEVLRGHVIRSKAGLMYHDASDFITKLDILLKKPERFTGGPAYINQRYSHEAVKGPLQRYILEKAKHTKNI